MINPQRVTKRSRNSYLPAFFSELRNLRQPAQERLLCLDRLAAFGTLFCWRGSSLYSSGYPSNRTASRQSMIDVAVSVCVCQTFFFFYHGSIIFNDTFIHALLIILKWLLQQFISKYQISQWSFR